MELLGRLLSENVHPSTKVVVNRGGYHQPIAGDQKVDNFSSQSAEAESASSKKI